MILKPTPRADRQAIDDRLYSREELALRLGCCVKTVDWLHKAGRLPGAIKIGRLVRFAKPLIDAWIAEQSRRENQA